MKVCWGCPHPLTFCGGAHQPTGATCQHQHFFPQGLPRVTVSGLPDLGQADVWALMPLSQPPASGRWGGAYTPSRVPSSIKLSHTSLEWLLAARPAPASHVHLRISLPPPPGYSRAHLPRKSLAFKFLPLCVLLEAHPVCPHVSGKRDGRYTDLVCRVLQREAQGSAGTQPRRRQTPLFGIVCLKVDSCWALPGHAGILEEFRSTY